LANGYVSVVPVKTDLTDKTEIRALAKSLDTNIECETETAEKEINPNYSFE
jgi:hypothetical protein